MYLTATSTPFIVLQNDVSHLWDAFNWVVGAIGVVSIFVILLLSVLQYVLDKRFIKQELKKTKGDLDNKQIEIIQQADNKITQQTDAIVEQLKNELVVAKEEYKKQLDDKEAQLKTQINDSKTEMSKMKNEIMGEIARSYANTNQDQNSPASAANWYLLAASSYVRAEKTHEMVDKCLVWALSAIRKIDKSTMQEEVDFLLERSEQNESYLKIVESSRGEKVKLIREEINKKLTT